MNLSIATLHANELASLLQMMVLFISTRWCRVFQMLTSHNEWGGGGGGLELTVSSPRVELVVSMEAQRSGWPGWCPHGMLLLTEMV